MYYVFVLHISGVEGVTQLPTVHIRSCQVCKLLTGISHYQERKKK